MPVARCDDCHAKVSWYAHAGRKLRELRCACGGKLTNAPWTRCSKCGDPWYHRIDKSTGKKTCNKCIDGEKVNYPRFSVSTRRPAMGATKINSVCKDEWRKFAKQVGGKLRTEYHHVGGEWVIRKASPEWSKTKVPRHFKPAFVGVDGSDKLSLPLCETLIEAKLSVANWISDRSEDMNHRSRALRAHRDGNAEVVLECIFDHIDESFEELKRSIDDRLDSLRISIS